MRVLEPYKGGLVVVGSFDETEMKIGVLMGYFTIQQDGPGSTTRHRFQTERVAHPWPVEHTVRLSAKEEPPNVEVVVILQPGQSTDALPGFEAGKPEFVARGSI